jgi:hypothetical protein
LLHRVALSLATKTEQAGKVGKKTQSVAMQFDGNPTLPPASETRLDKSAAANNRK